MNGNRRYLHRAGSEAEMKAATVLRLSATQSMNNILSFRVSVFENKVNRN